MTTIAYKDGVIAGDTMVWEGQTATGHAAKVGRLPDGSLWGFAGMSKDLSRLKPWLLCPIGNPVEIDKESSLMIVLTDGRVMFYEENGFLETKAPFHAFGSGSDIAMGAMWAGATAQLAVAAAIDMNAYTAGDVMSFALGKEPEVGPVEEEFTDEELAIPPIEEAAPVSESWRKVLGL